MRPGEKVMEGSCVDAEAEAGRALITRSSENVGSAGRASGAEEEALSNQLVLKQIFASLDTKTLLEISLVNKIWRSTARTMLRSRRECLVGIKGRKPCQELVELNQMLLKSSGHPYSGLVVRMKLGKVGHECTGADDEDEHGVEPSAESRMLAYTAVMEELTFRYLEIDWDSNLDFCPAEIFVANVLKEKTGEIVEMKIRNLPPSILFSLRAFLQVEELFFPNLKILDLFPDEASSVVSGTQQSFKYDLINAAPQLQLLLGMNGLMDLPFFLQNDKVRVMRDYVVSESDLMPAQIHKHSVEILNFLTKKPKLAKLLLPSSYYLNFDENVVNFMRPLLQCLSSSLKEINVYQSMLVDLMPKTIVKPFRHLKQLTLGLSWSIDRRIGFPTLERFNWGEFFPGLQIIKCIDGNAYFSDEDPLTDSGVNIEQQLREDLLQRSSSTPCQNVEQVIFDGNLPFSDLRYFARIFPRVKEFCCKVGAGNNRLSRLFLFELLEFLWTTWPNLERITVLNAPEDLVIKNLDARLCGISEEEAEKYRNDSTDFLTSKKFSPTAPSMLSFQRLKKLRIEINHWQCPSRRNIKGDSSKFLLTGVTRLLAFARMPGFEMEVVRACCSRGALCEFQLEHLRPFVTLTDSTYHNLDVSASNYQRRT